MYQERPPGSADHGAKVRRCVLALCQDRPLPPSLVRLLLSRLERRWYGTSDLPLAEEVELAGALYKTRGYLRRRTPNEIEAVLTTIDDKALNMISQGFGSPVNLTRFAEAIVKTGTYDADHVLAFVGGVIDLFLEVLWSQAENAHEDQEPYTVNWCQLMNHFIESPEIAMYEGSEVTVGLADKAAGALDKQITRNSYVDRAKHFGSTVEKMYWIPYLEMMATIEGTESVYLWSPTVAVEAPKAVTPELPQETHYDKKGRPLFKVMAMDWDPDLQDLAVLLSNRMLLIWRLRSKEKGQFQQKRELRFGAKRMDARGDKEPDWKVFLNILDPKTMENLHDRKKPEDADEKGEAAMRRELREQRLADEASAQLDIWFNSHLQLWVTSDVKGRLFMWDLRTIEGTWLEANLQPARRLVGHTRLVTSHLELSKHKFTTTSLDRSILLWDNRNLSTPEMRITDPLGSVLSQAYIPLYNMLVSVGCEKIVYCFTIDSTAYRGVRKKLSGHQSNVLQVAGGNTVFFTLDEGFVMIVWDALSLVQLQTISCSDIAPRHLLSLPQLGKVCVAGRRLSFYEGNEHAAIAIGAAPTKDFVVRAKIKQEEGASLKERAPVKWVGMAADRGTMLSATEVEVRLHTRSQPEQFKTIFNASEGDTITDIAASERLALVVIGTAKGSIHFLKYRSGCALKVYPGRTDDVGRGLYSGANKAKASAEADEEAGGDGDSQARAASRTRVRPDALAEYEGRTKSPATGSRSPAARVGSAVSSPQAGANKLGLTSGGETTGEGAPSEEEGKEPEAAPPVVGKGAPRGGPVLANAPSPEELVRGLSRTIKCVLTCEDERRVYVGTLEGQVIIFRCDSRCEFPVERWATCPDLTSAEPQPGKTVTDAPAVTCLHCVPRACVATTTEEEAGLLLVGTQDGVVHLFNMLNLKLAGSINIPRALPSEEDFAQRGDRICQLRLFQDLPAEPELPLTLLTVDAHSRLRLWGFKIHVQEWKLVALKLILDAGQLLECQCVGSSVQEALKAAKTKSQGRHSKESLVETLSAGKAKEEGGAKAQVALRKASVTPVCITAETVLPWRLALPTKALKKQPFEGPRYAKEAREQASKGEVLRIGLEANGKPMPEDKEKDNGKKKLATGTTSLQNTAAFITQPPGSAAGSRTPKAAASDSFRDEPLIKEGLREISGSESEGDADEVVGRKLLDRPKSPPRVVRMPAGAEEDEAAQAEHANLEATAKEAAEEMSDGRSLLFLADSGGWIWCIDIAATLEGVVASSPPIAVNLQSSYKESPSRARASAESISIRRTTTRPPSTFSSPSLAGGAAAVAAAAVAAHHRDDDRGLLASRAPRPRPEAIKVVGAWPAHPEVIISLVPVGAPPALVSTDAAKEVKVWSSAGDLWGHFSMHLEDGGARPVVAVWPPPHVLGVQIALMRMAKGLCKKMGFTTRRRGRRGTQMLSRHTKRMSSHRLHHMAATERSGTFKRSKEPTEVRPSSQGTQMARTEEAAAWDATISAVELASIAREASVGELSARPVSPGGGNEEEEEKTKRKVFTTGQLSEMLRNRAFSSGCQSYSQYARKSGLAARPGSWRMRTGFSSQEEDQRKSFRDRSPDTFGVELFSERDVEAWETGVRSMGQKSASEGALLRYAHSAVEKEAKWVREALGVDVAQVTRKQIRSPSFLVQLDSWPVSHEPSSPLSATAQAVKKLGDAGKVRKVLATPPLVNAGAMTMSMGTRPRPAKR